MRKNLISFLALEDRGYEILFIRGQVLIYPRGVPTDLARVIGVRHAKLYKFAFQPLLALSSSIGNRASSLELCEILHCRMGAHVLWSLEDIAGDHYRCARFQY